MKRLMLSLLALAVLFCGCGDKKEPEKEASKEQKIVILQADTLEEIVTLTEEDEVEAFASVIDSDDWGWNVPVEEGEYSWDGMEEYKNLIPEYIVEVHQEKTPTVIQDKSGEDFEKIMEFTTYEGSDKVKLTIGEETIKNVSLPEDCLTFYSMGTEEFFSALDDALEEK